MPGTEGKASILEISKTDDPTAPGLSSREVESKSAGKDWLWTRRPGNVHFLENFVDVYSGQCVFWSCLPHFFPQLSWTLICYGPKFMPTSPFDLLSSISVAYMYVGVEPTAGAWTTYQGPQPLRKTLSFSLGPSVTNVSSARGGASWNRAFLEEIKRECLNLDPSCLGKFTWPSVSGI